MRLPTLWCAGSGARAVVPESPVILIAPCGLWPCCPFHHVLRFSKFARRPPPCEPRNQRSTGNLLFLCGFDLKFSGEPTALPEETSNRPTRASILKFARSQRRVLVRSSKSKK